MLYVTGRVSPAALPAHRRNWRIPMEKKRFHLFENKFYWIALILSLLTLLPTDRHLIVWYGMAAVLFATLLFSWIDLGPQYLPRYVKENRKQSVPILLFSIAHAAVLSKSFYMLWLPSNKLAALASRFHLNAKQALWIIILFVFPCMVCSLFVLLSFLLTKYQKDRHPIVGIGVLLFFALLAFQSSQAIGCVLVGGMQLKHVFCGTLIVFAMISLLNVLLANDKVSVLVGTLPFLIYSTINYYVFCFRGRELCPYDLLSVGTAMNVASDYQFFFSLFMLIGWLAWVFLMAAFFLTKRETKTRKKPVRLCSCAVCLLSLLLVFVLEKDTPVKSWALSGSQMNGTALNFFLQLRDGRIKTPENYSTDTLRQLEAQYQTEENAANIQKPTIIVIMNESFTDFRVLGNDVQTETPLLPFFSSLTENTIRGYVYSSVYGGNTANSEFEFLTGDTTAFLPAGSVPYQQYLIDQQYSILSYLHAAGYTCVATHPYIASGWNRPEVYGYFGFDETTFLSDYPETELTRKYIGDREMYEYIIDWYEDRDQTKDFFLFGITIQNHGGYTYSNFESAVPLAYPTHYPEAEQYLTLANLSDQALEYLIRYFSETPDPVVICFFGDHQPRVEAGFLEQVHGGGFDDLDSEMLKYKVPFLIWANYDIQEQSEIETSINYLSTYLLEACGFDLPAYNKFLKDAEQRIPIITAYGYYSASSGRFLPVEEAAEEEQEMLNLYRILEYNNLFDKERISLIFQP